MNCPKCGAPLYRGDRYCEECGTPVRERTKAVNTDRTSGSHAKKRSGASFHFPQTDMPRVTELPILSNPVSRAFLVAVLIWLVLIPYTFVKSIDISVLGFITHEYASFSLYSFWAYAGAPLVGIITAGICFVNLIVMLVPMLLNKPKSTLACVLSILGSLLCVLLWLLTIGLASNAGKSTYGIAKPQYTAWFWLYLVNCIALLIISVTALVRGIKQGRGTYAQR